MNKKYLIVGLMVLVALIIIALIFLILFLPKKKAAKTTVQRVTTLEDKIFDPKLIEANNSIDFLGNQGSIFKKFLLKDQKTEQLFSDEVLFIQRVKYSPDGEKALVLIKDNDNYFWQLITFSTGVSRKLSQNIFDADWLDSENIVYSSPDDGLLRTMNLVGGLKDLIDVDIFGAVLSVSGDGKKIIVYPTPEGYGENRIYLYDVAQKSFEKLSEETLVGALWSPNSGKILSEKVNENGEILALQEIDIANKKEKEIAIQTDLGKVAWIGNEQIVATGTKDTTDNLLSFVDLNSNKITSKEAILEKPYNNLNLEIRNLMYSAFDKILYFTASDILYKLELK